MSLKTFIWSLSGDTWYNCRIVDSNMKVIFQWDEKDTGQKVVTNQRAKFAGIIPKTPLIQTKGHREIVFHDGDARPITYEDIEKYESDIKKLKPKQREKLFFTRHLEFPKKEDGELDAGKIASTHPITKEIPGRWLFEVLRSNFIPQIMQTPEDKFSWLKDVAIAFAIVLGFIGGMYFLSQIILKGNGG